MSFSQFKNVGLIIRESKTGDILIGDPIRKTDIIIAQEFIESARTDEHKAKIVADKLCEYIEQHRDARWLTAAEKLQKIKPIDPKFVGLLRPYLKDRTPTNLRKVEKDIFFLIQSTPEIAALFTQSENADH